MASIAQAPVTPEFLIGKLPEGGYVVASVGKVDDVGRWLAAFTDADEALDFLREKFLGSDEPEPAKSTEGW